MWIARDKDGELNLFKDKPYCTAGDWWNPCDEDDYICVNLDSNTHQEVTFETSPQEVFLYTKKYLDEILYVEYSKGFEDGESSGFKEGYKACQEEYIKASNG